MSKIFGNSNDFQTIDSMPDAPMGATHDNPTGTDDIIYSAASRRFIVNGEKMTLTEMIFEVTAKAANSAKNMLAMSAQSLQDANEDGNAAIEWRNKLEALKPQEGSGENVSASGLGDAIHAFQQKYGFNPMEKYNLNQYEGSDKTVSYDDCEKMTKSVESYISTVSNNQSKINLDVERYTHIVNEAEQLVSSVDKLMSDELTSTISKTG